MIDSWLTPEKQYNPDNILIRSDVFDVGDEPSMHPNFFNCISNDSRGHLYVNNNSISDTQILHHVLLRSFIRMNRGNIEIQSSIMMHLGANYSKLGFITQQTTFKLIAVIHYNFSCLIPT